MLHQLDKALPLFRPQKRGGRDPHILEKQLGRVLAFQPHLVEQTPAAETFHFIGLDEEERGALIPFRRIGLGDHNDQIGGAAIGDESLRTVDPISIAIFHCGGFHTLQVRPGTRLGHGNGPDQLARHHARQKAVFLLFRAIMPDIGRDDGIVQGGSPAFHAHVRSGHVEHIIMAPVTAGSAIFFRTGGHKKTGFAGLGPDLAVDHSGLFPAVCVRFAFFFDEAAHGIFKNIDVFAVEPFRLRHTNRIVQHDQPPQVLFSIIQEIKGRPTCFLSGPAPVFFASERLGFKRHH